MTSEVDAILNRLESEGLGHGIAVAMATQEAAALIRRLEKERDEARADGWDEGFVCGAYAEANAKKGKLDPDIQNPYRAAARVSGELKET